MAKFTTLIREDEIENATTKQLCEAVAMSGEEIAKALGVTRQYVSNTLKSAMRKVYLAIKEASGDEPFKVAVTMGKLLNADVLAVNKTSKIQGTKDNTTIYQGFIDFFNLFPPDIRKEIEEDARKYLKKQPAIGNVKGPVKREPKDKIRGDHPLPLTVRERYG